MKITQYVEIRSGLSPEEVDRRARTLESVLSSDPRPTRRVAFRATRRRVVPLALAVALAIPGLAISAQHFQWFGPDSPAAWHMSVFDRASQQPVPDNVLDEISQSTRDTPPSISNEDPGRLRDTSEARTLIVDAGSRDLSVYAIPTGKSGVCYQDSTGAGGCVPHFSEEKPVHYYVLPQQAASDLPALWGIAPNEVEKIILTTSRGQEELAIRNNAFFWEGDPGTEAQTLEVTVPDGSTRRIELPSGAIPEPKQRCTQDRATMEITCSDVRS